MDKKSKKKETLLLNLPKSRYQDILSLQRDIVASRINKIFDKDIFILVEHFPVFTLGKRGGKENLIVSESFLESKGADIVPVERGGNITYHGPGQLVIYPIIDLNESGFGVKEYVGRLEEVMIRACNQWQIEAVRDSANRGVWVGKNKIGSVGICVRRGVCFHGLALNVNLSLEPFSWINPCGLKGIGVTSMKEQAEKNIDLDEAKEVSKVNLEEIFNIKLVDTEFSVIDSIVRQVQKEAV